MASGQHGNADFPPENANQQPEVVKLGEEERRILKECERESFFQRALPLSCGAILGVQYLVRSGKIAGHPKYGSIPKSIIAAGLAYLTGKVSYIPVCRQKILEKIPDSKLAMTIRKGQKEPAPTWDKRMQQESYNSEREDPRADQYSQYRSTLPASPSYDGLNDSERPSMDNEVQVREDPEEKKNKSGTTYEDLRKKNRQEYNDRISSQTPPKSPGSPSYKDSPFMPQKAWPDQKSPEAPHEAPTPDRYQAPTKRKRTNIWGDVIED